MGAVNMYQYTRATFVVIVVWVGLSGCVSPPVLLPVPLPAPERPTVMRTAVEPAGANCASGGRKVESGLDRDHDGQLDDAEVLATSYVCDAPTRMLLLRAETEPVGTHCSVAGTAVSAGLDLNGNGVLDDDEVSTVQYQCGTKLAALMARSIAEAAGAHCAFGGTRVEVGTDRDFDGTLSDHEVEQSLWVCTPRPAGPVLVRKTLGTVPNCRGTGFLVSAGIDDDGDGVLSDLEVDATTGVCSPVVATYQVATRGDFEYLVQNVWLVVGDLEFSSSDLTTIAFPQGLGVAGTLRVTDNPKLTDLSLRPIVLGGDIIIARNPALASVRLEPGLLLHSPIAGSVVVEDAPVLKVFWSSISALGGSLTISRTGLEFLWVPSLLRVGGDVTLERNPVLRAVTLNELAATDGLDTIGGTLRVADNGALTSLNATALRRIDGDLVLSNNDAMVTLGSDWVGHRVSPTWAGELAVGGTIIVRDNASLVTTSALAARSASGLTITNNAALTSTEFRNLTTILGNWTVTDNPVLEFVGTTPSSLTDVTGSIEFARNPSLASIPSLSALRALHGGLSVRDAPLLEYVGLGDLLGAASLTFQDTGLRWLGRAPAGSYFDNLTGLSQLEELTLMRNPRLTDLHLPLLSHLSSLSVIDSPQLPNCQAQNLATQTGAVATLSGNDATATCP
jgi:hypothetical protein